MAFAIMLKTLNTIFTGTNFCRVPKRHCARVAVQPRTIVSGRFSSSTLSRMKRKLTDMVPSMPGS